MVQPITIRLSNNKTFCLMPTSHQKLTKEQKDQPSSSFMEVALKEEAKRLDVNTH